MFDLESLKDETFSWQAAASLAHASKISYQPAKTVRGVAIQRWGFADCEFLDIASTQGFIARSKDVVLIVFRGTTDVADWLANLNVASQERPYGRVHAGFLRCYMVAHAKVMAAAGNGSGRKIWLAGHSLGGALSVIAAAEMQTGVSGVYTFGQPRVGDATFRQYIDAKLSRRFFRFVNDDDLVTRVPPGFAHAGSLIHFDGGGQLAPVMVEAEGEAVEPPSLTGEEFAHLQQQLKGLHTSFAQEGVPELEGVFTSSVEGLFPSIADHNLDTYISLIRRMVPIKTFDAALEVVRQTRARRIETPMSAASESTGLHTQSLDDASLESIEMEVAPSGDPTTPEGAPFPVLLRLKQASWIAPADLTVNSHFGTFVSAQTTGAALKLLKADPNVISIEASRDAGFEELDASLPFVGGVQIHRPPIGEKGDAAVIGIIDSGVDILHDAFRDAAGKTRIIAVWNQKEGAGPAPRAIDPKFTQSYGTLYTHKDIDDFINGAKETPDALRDPLRHGTHVASIAAGRGWPNGMSDGMAPEAKIVVVIPNMNTAPGDPPSLGYSSSHVDALYFLKVLAQGANAILPQALPIAVNVSLGMNAGAHDGSSNLEAAFDSMTNMGHDRGYVIVKSAGNERGAGSHTREQAQPGAIVTVEWDSVGVRDQDYMEAWYSSNDDLEFVLVDPITNASAPVNKTVRDYEGLLGGNLCRMHLVQSCADNGDSRLIVMITRKDNDIQTGKWSLRIEGKDVLTDGWVDMWVERHGSTKTAQFTNDVDDITVTIPATAETVIAVGACNSSTPLQLTSASSYGLTRNQKLKPDVCAPGLAINAAAAGSNNHAAVAPMTGTSMAAPHVTGALALALSSRHKSGGVQHNARQLRAALTRTVKNARARHHRGYGYGAMDALALFNALKALP